MTTEVKISTLGAELVLPADSLTNGTANAEVHDGLPPDVALDDFVKAVIAEIERREGYETLLRGALIYCKTGEVFK